MIELKSENGNFQFVVFNNCVCLTHSHISLLSGAMYLPGGIFEICEKLLTS